MALDFAGLAPRNSHKPQLTQKPGGIELSLRSWTDDINPATIPDAVIASENARRNARKRKSYTGGIEWARHNPKVKNCRCKRCNERRARNPLHT